MEDKRQSRRGPGRTGKQAPKSLFSVANGQSLASQVDDTILVLRWIVRSVKSSTSPGKFALRYVINPVFKNDMFIISFGLPALSGTPRVLDKAPGVRSSASTWTYHGERSARELKNLVNAASYNYLGFIDLEYNTARLLQHAIRALPFADDGRGSNKALEDEVKREFRQFMSMHGCVLTASGYAVNLVAFPAMAASARAGGTGIDRQTVFLMDSESHSSMFMGAFIACASKKARIIKFAHNDIADLAAKLDEVYHHRGDEDSSRIATDVWVAVEGLYSMDGTVAPLPEIIHLKRRYGFRIYIDEAHSFLSIGHSGRGIAEHFRDRGSSPSIQISDIDMLGGTLSKSLSSVGGFVLCAESLTQHVEARNDEMKESGDSSIPTLSLIRTLQIMKKPQLISQRINHLQSISTYVAEALKTKGYRISTTLGGPFIAIIFDTVNRVLEFLRVGRKIGLICCGAAYPAAPRGAPRVRLSLTSAHTWRDVSEMLQLIDKIAVKIGVKGLRTLNQNVVSSVAVAEEETVWSPSLSSLEEADATEASDKIDASILAVCPPPSDLIGADAHAVRTAGLTALSRYNLGAAGPRWMYGTFSAHMALEDRLNSTISGMIASKSGYRAHSGGIKTTLFTDARVGIMSIISICMEGLTRRRSRNGEKHLVLLPHSAGREIREGAAAAQRDRSTVTRWFGLPNATGMDDGDGCMQKILSAERSTFSQTHVTVFVDTGLLGQSVSQEECCNEKASRLSELMRPLSEVASRTASHPPLTVTLLIKDPHMFVTGFASTRGIISALRSLFPDVYSSDTMRFLIYSPFLTLPRLPGLQGAFCTGSKHLIEKIQFLGQGVMYTAMMPPTTAALAEASINQMLEESA